ncbi:MAG: hypothetical protein ABH885_00590, partial [Candidatus Omnitrophota bacterium]
MAEFKDGSKSKEAFGLVIAVLLVMAFLMTGKILFDGITCWGLAVIVVALFVFLFAFMHKGAVLYEAVYLFFMGHMLIYLPAVFLMPPDTNLQPEHVSKALMALSFSLIAFIAGYGSALGKVLAEFLPLRNFMMTEKKLAQIPQKLYFLWILIMVVNILPGIRFPSVFFAMTQVFAILLIQTALMIDARFVFTNDAKVWQLDIRHKARVRLIVFFAAYAVECLASGFSGLIMIPIALICIVYIREKRTFPVRGIVILFILIMLMFSYVIPACKIYRIIDKTEYGLWDRVSMACKITSMNSNRERIERSFIRYNNVFMITVICEDLREKGIKPVIYRGFYDVISRFIPRFIWRGKPKISIDANEVGRRLGILQETDRGTSVSLPLLGGFILWGGLPGAVAGYFFVGLLMRMFWVWLVVRSGSNFLSFAIYSAICFGWILGGLFFSAQLICTTTFIAYSYILSGFLKEL